MFNWLNSISIVSFILCVVLIIVNSILINGVFSRANFFSKSTLIPSLLYITLITFQNEVSLEPVLFLHTIFLQLVNLLMKIDQNNSAIHIAFKSGLLIGLMMVFSLYYGVMALAIYVTLFSVKSFNWSEWSLVFLGLIIYSFYF